MQQQQPYLAYACCEHDCVDILMQALSPAEGRIHCLAATNRTPKNLIQLKV